MGTTLREGRSHDPPAGGVRSAAGDRGQAETGRAGEVGGEVREGAEIRAGRLLREVAVVEGGRVPGNRVGARLWSRDAVVSSFW